MGSAFSWSYALAQIPGGAVLDRFGTRMVYFVSLVSWSVVTMLQGLVSTVGAFIGLRVALGCVRGALLPGQQPRAEQLVPATRTRARQRASTRSALSAGLAFFLTVPLFWIAEHYTWRGLFIVAGGIGVLFGVVWYAFYREPRDSKLVNQAELDYIAAGGGFAKDGIAQTPVSWSNILKVSRLRPILIISLAQFCGNTVLTFFLIDFVNYLATQRHMAWIKLGIFVSFPVHGGGGRRPRRRRGGRSDHQARRLGHVCPEAAGGLGADHGLIARAGQLGARRSGQPRDCHHVGGVLRPGDVESGLDGADRPRAEEHGGTGRRLLQHDHQSRRHPDALHPRRDPAGHDSGSYFYSLIYVGVVPLFGACLYIFALGDIKRLEVATE